MHDQIMNPARLPKNDPVYMPPKIVTGDKAKNVAAYVALVAAAGGKDTGRLAEAVKPASSNKPVAAKDGVLDMPADPNGQLAYVSKQATHRPASSRSSPRTTRTSRTTSRSRATGSTRRARRSPPEGRPRSPPTSSPAPTRTTAPSPATVQGGMEGKLTVK